MKRTQGLNILKLICVTAMLVFGAGAAGAGTAYVANEASGTVSVIDTATRTITATIGLGSDLAIPGTPQPDGPFNAETQHHNPFYNGYIGTHGLWLTPDGSILLVANRLSGTVVAVDTANNTVLGYAPVGREPHLVTVRPGGQEAWVAVRGESHIDVLKIDRDDLIKPGRRRTARMETLAAIDTVRGPSMVTFTSDGKFAFVCGGKQNRVDKIDATTRRVVASETTAAAFSPFCLVSPDDEELYVVHKGAQKLSVFRTRDLGIAVNGMTVGPCANHVWFVGKLAYITIGGEPPCAPAGVDRPGKIVIVDRTTHRIVHELTGPAYTGDPHGIWGAPSGQLYVGHERGNRISVINTGNPDDPSDDTVEGIVTGSSRDLGFIKQPIDVVVKP